MKDAQQKKKNHLFRKNKSTELFQSRIEKSNLKEVLRSIKTNVENKVTKWTNESSKPIGVTSAKRGKTHVIKSCLCLILYLIGWVGTVNDSSARQDARD